MITLANIVGRSRILDAWDADALAYIANVEAADGAALSTKVKRAINRFVRACKRDASPVSGVSNWDAIKASCLLAGPATLSGALVPLKGPAPTNTNFVAGDYNPATGLKGNGATKRLNTNFNNATLTNPINRSASAYALIHTPGGILMGCGQLEVGVMQVCVTVEPSVLLLRVGSSSALGEPVSSYGPGLFGVGRSSSTHIQWVMPDNDGSTDFVLGSSDVFNGSQFVFSRVGTPYSDARIAFYHLGEAVDFVALRTALNSYMEAIA